MNNFDNKMEKIFDVSATEPTEVFPNKEPIRPIVAVNYNKPDLGQDLTDAYQQSRENLQGIIDQGKDAMEEILEIAKQGQHPRAFEVYGTLLKNMVDANKELLNIQKQMREMDGKKNDGGTKIDKAAIFVGSTAELNKLIKGKE